MNPELQVRSDWHFDVVACLQRAVGDLLDTDAVGFGLALSNLRQRLPPAASTIESLLLRQWLRGFTLSAGRSFHASFHHLVGGAECADAPAEACDVVWQRPPSDVDSADVLLGEWCAMFSRRFQRGHTWPIEVRAASMLQRNFREPFHLNALADAVWCSRAALVRRFTKRYGMTPGEYHRRLRTAEATRLLRQSDICVDAVARAVGYASTKNLYAALYRRTGLCPAQIREQASRGREVKPTGRISGVPL